MYEVRQPKDSEPKGSAQVTTGYFRDLAATAVFRLTTISSSAAVQRISLVVFVEVGTLESALRPGREPAERRLQHRCPLVHTSGSIS
jgi:hypothetical protein